MNILVTGGCGYIGHYAVDELISKGNKVIVVDDLSTGYKEALNIDAKFYNVDIRNIELMENIFEENSIDLVMDFAARLVVEESITNPQEYYDINVNGLKVVLDCMVKYNVKNIIFSSTAAVHGMLDKKEKLITEDDITIPSNPYGETKLAGENMIKCYSKAYGLNYIIFRYFNVVGGNKPGGSLEEFTTILPRIISSIKLNTELQVFGGDYSTVDGTCIRDYIHVYDLISAHMLVCDRISEIDSGIYNLSIGKGTSILELIKSAAKVLDKKVNYKIVDRRIGDPVVSAASNKKFTDIIPWEPKYNTIELMIKESYEAWKK